VERVKKTEIAETLTDTQAMDFVYQALRQNALILCDSLKEVVSLHSKQPLFRVMQQPEQQQSQF
jgi:hypothetical protein